MFNLKKAMVAGATFVLAAGIIAPFGVADAATDCTYVNSVENNTIDVDDGGSYTVTTKIGSKESKEVYENADEIDLSYLNGKEADITIAKGEEKWTFKVAAQAKKVKAKFDPKTYTATLEVDGAKVDANKTNARIGNQTVKLDTLDLEAYTVKGATMYLSKEENPIDAASETVYTPASKEAKVKIPAKKNGPKVVIDPKKFTFKLAKGCEYEAQVGNRIVSDTAASAKVVSMKDVATLLNTEGKGEGNKVDITDTAKEGDVVIAYGQVGKDITFKFYKSATDRTMKSKATVVEVPAQAEVDSKELMSCEATFNSKHTEATGILVKNTTQGAIEFMVAKKGTKIEEIDLTAKTTKWTTLAKNGSSKKIAAKKLSEGDFLIVRVAGQKENAKKNIKFALASEIATCGGVIVLPEKVKTDLGASIGMPGQEVQASPNASQTAITVPTSGYTKFTYEIGDKEVKVYEIGKAAPGATIANGDKVNAQAGKWITIYAENANKEVVAFKSMKIEKSHLK